MWRKERLSDSLGTPEGNERCKRALSPAASLKSPQKLQEGYLREKPKNRATTGGAGRFWRYWLKKGQLLKKRLQTLGDPGTAF